MKVQTSQTHYAHESFMETLSIMLDSKPVNPVKLTVVQNQQPVKEDKDDMDYFFGVMVY